MKAKRTSRLIHGRWHMPRVNAPVVVSANCLRSGQVVYLGAGNSWTVEWQAAVPFDCVQAATAAMQAAADESVVIGAYLVSVKAGAGALSPIHYREGIRLEGPGTYITEPTRSPQLVSL